jgi:flagellum-specific peptidoglycan hydrolase FlgJ
MPHTQHDFSEWARTYNSRYPPTQRPFWGFYANAAWKIAVLSALTYIVWSDKFSIALMLGARANEQLMAKAADVAENAAFAGWDLHAASRPETKPKPKRKTAEAPHTNELPPVRIPAHADSETYIKRFAPVAVAEMRKFGIPASIILAQGLLESNAGGSSLAQRANNHFGIKCFSRHCKKGHCMNFTDDTHKDFFMKYNNAWSSYRAHSDFLRKSERYQHLFKTKQYNAWAIGLERAGYATDSKYAEKLIGVIHRYNLNRFDVNI